MGGRRRGNRQHLRSRPPLGPQWQSGTHAKDIGPSRDAQTTEIYALTDMFDRPGAFLLTPGNARHLTTAQVVLAVAPGRIRPLAADEIYDAD